MNKKIDCKELIEIFLQHSIYDIKSEIETPNINFKFKENDYSLFNKLIDDNKYKLHHIDKNDLNFLINRSHDDCLNIQINDCISFFKYLTDITNETIKLFNEYEDNVIPRETAIYLLRRIWLRMVINDVENISSFLENQLQFVKNRTFDCIDSKYIGKFLEYNVSMKTRACDLWDETTRRMIFTIEKDIETYELPHILYDINDDSICYIYGVQSSQREKSKKIERSLYKLNKDIDNPNVHPSKVCALLFFIDQLSKKGITKIVIPSMQVLSYHYHELLSEESKKNYDEIKKQYIKNPTDSYIKGRYEYFKNWYEHVYQKQDKISYLKTEELIYLVYRITKHNPNIEIINDINIQGDYLILKLTK